MQDEHGAEIKRNKITYRIGIIFEVNRTGLKVDEYQRQRVRGLKVMQTGRCAELTRWGLTGARFPGSEELSNGA